MPVGQTARRERPALLIARMSNDASAQRTTHAYIFTFGADKNLSWPISQSRRPHALRYVTWTERRREHAKKIRTSLRSFAR